MGRMTAGLLLFILAIFAPARLYGQEVLLPLMVDGPRISRTAFTNWEKIELTYTIRWIDGYEPMMDLIKPQAMSFGVLELDPEFADESDIKNERKFEKKNYFDITYHLRYMSENKGEIPIAGPKFAYRDLLSKESAVQYFSTQGFNLSYVTVLTSDAEEIKEEFNLGSYQSKATLWRVYAGAMILVGIVGTFVLIFFRPVPAPLATAPGELNVIQVVDMKLDTAKIVSELEGNIASGNLGAICNGLGDVIRAYAPGIKHGMTSKDMDAQILSISHEWERSKLLRIHAALYDIENHLFVGGECVDDKVKYHMSHLAVTVHELRPWSVYWHRHLFGLKERLTRPFSSLKRFSWTKP